MRRGLYRNPRAYDRCKRGVDRQEAATRVVVENIKRDGVCGRARNVVSPIIPDRFVPTIGNEERQVYPRRPEKR